MSSAQFSSAGLGPGSKIETKMIRLKIVSEHGFRVHTGEMPVVNSLVWVRPEPELSWRPCLEVMYLSDGTVDYVPLSEVGEGKGWSFFAEEESGGVDG